jgi:hypothetical protein
MKNNEDIRDWIFSSFLTVYVYSDTKVDQILTVYRKQSVESKSVEILWSISNGFWVRSVLIFIFLTVCTNSVMTYLEKVLVSNL